MEASGRRVGLARCDARSARHISWQHREDPHSQRWRSPIRPRREDSAGERSKSARIFRRLQTRIARRLQNRNIQRNVPRRTYVSFISLPLRSPTFKNVNLWNVSRSSMLNKFEDSKRSHEKKRMSESFIRTLLSANSAHDHLHY